MEDENTCKLKKIATDICLKVGINEKGIWAANESYGDFGCGIYNNNFAIARYQIRAMNNTELIHFNFSTSLRSVTDPLVVVSNLTGGSLIFEFSQRLKWMIILAFFSVGGLCSFLFIVVLCKCGIERLCFDSSARELPRDSSFYGLDSQSSSTQPINSINPQLNAFKSLNPHLSNMPYDGFSRRREMPPTPPPTSDTHWEADTWNVKPGAAEYENE